MPQLKKLFLALLGLSGLNALFRRLNRGRIKTLMYHSVSRDGERLFPNANYESDFRRQMEHLKRHYCVLRLSQEGEWTGYDPGRVNVLLTFDDGFRDNYTVAFRVLQEFGFGACFFLISGCLPDGASPAFASKYAANGDLAPFGTVTATQAQEMIARGMTIGSHGERHCDYSTVPLQVGLADALCSQKALQEAVGRDVTLLALPWGRRHEGQFELLQESYRRIFTTDHGFNCPEDRLLRRNEVSGVLHLAATASGSLDFFASILRWR